MLERLAQHSPESLVPSAWRRQPPSGKLVDRYAPAIAATPASDAQDLDARRCHGLDDVLRRVNVGHEGVDRGETADKGEADLAELGRVRDDDDLARPSGDQGVDLGLALVLCSDT